MIGRPVIESAGSGFQQQLVGSPREDVGHAAVDGGGNCERAAGAEANVASSRTQRTRRPSAGVQITGGLQDDRPTIGVDMSVSHCHGAGQREVDVPTPDARSSELTTVGLHGHGNTHVRIECRPKTSDGADVVGRDQLNGGARNNGSAARNDRAVAGQSRRAAATGGDVALQDEVVPRIEGLQGHSVRADCGGDGQRPAADTAPG